MTDPLLIISDVHEEIERVRDILHKYSHIKQKVWLGDFFDSWNQPWQSFKDTVTLVQTLCDDETNTLILGNHDASYWWGGVFRCSGWKKEKSQYIHTHLTEAEWSRFQLYTWAGKFLCSHAGIHPYFFPKRQFQEACLQAMSRDALRDAAVYKTHPLLGSGVYRGGSQNKGGIMWLDWDKEFEPFPGVNQIVGHTFQRDHRVKALSIKDSRNYCMDTALCHVALVEGDKVVFESV